MCCQHRPDHARGGNLKRIGEQFSAQDSGTLSIATTHTQARYVLPAPVAKLRDRLSQGQHQPAPGFTGSGGSHADGRSGRDRHRHRIAGGLRRTRHPALLRMAACAGAAGGPSADPQGTHQPGRYRARTADHLPPFLTGRTRIDHAFAQRKLSRASRWKPSTRTSSPPMCASDWASASWRRWPCAT
jgi:LysR family cys regulon transcriptional activator